MDDVQKQNTGILNTIKYIIVLSVFPLSSHIIELMDFRRPKYPVIQ